MRALLGLIFLLGLNPVVVHAAAGTYHLHNEASTTSGLKQLMTTGPDTAAAALQASLTNKAVAEYMVQAFDTQSGVPNSGGIIPSGSTVSFTIWMNKTANVATMYPRAKLYLNNTSGTQLCTATGTTAISTTLAKYSLSCTTSAAITMFTTDRFYLWTGVNLTATSTKTFAAVVEIEGTLNGNYDSQIVVPLPNAPAISSLSPTSGGAGTSVTIIGTNFGATQGSSTVTFNGLSATTSSWSSTSIVASVPTGAATGPVVVTVGGSASNGITFTVVATPTISSVSPTSGAVGTSVTISGNNFGATQGASTVTFNGISATMNSWSSTSIVTTVPTSATTGPVVVAVGGYASNGVTFTVIPTINSLSPNSGGVGTSVTISGSGFGSTQGTSIVTFNGVVTTISSWSSSSIVTTVPAAATTGPVVVTVGAIASNSVAFTVTLTITSLSPASGQVGTSVTIAGSGFGSTQGSSTVTFNGMPATITSWSSTSISAAVPAGATTGPVIVRVGGIISNGVTFTVIPTISSLSPTSGPDGASVTIVGSGFGATQVTSTVTFNGLSATTSGWSITTIVATVPTGATTGPVVVTVSGTASNGVTFTVLDPAAAIDFLYHLHKEASTTSGLDQLKTASPDASAFALNSVQLKSLSPGDYLIEAFDSQAGDPGVLQILPAGTQIDFLMWTRETASFGTMFPKVKLSLNSATGTPLCSATGAVPLNTTVSQYILSCTTTSSVTLATTDRFYLWVGISLTASPGANRVTAELDIEGQLTYNYDSRLLIGVPVVQSISPVSGPVGTAVTINGMNFGSTQGTNTVSLNGTRMTPTSWNGTTITTTVPANVSEMPGLASVTVGGWQSNGTLFSVDLPSGYITDVAGGPNNGFSISGDGGPAPSAGMGGVLYTAVDSIGNIYVTTTDLSGALVPTVRRIGTDGTITTFAGTGVSGYSGDGGPATLAQLTGPMGLAVDAQGNIYIADTNKIRKVDTQGIISTVPGTNGINATDVALDSAGNLYITDVSSCCALYLGGAFVTKVTPSGSASRFAGNGIYGFSGDGGIATAAEFNGTTGISVDGNGNVYVADYCNNRIRMINVSGIINTIAGAGVAGTGGTCFNQGYNGDNRPATTAYLVYPRKIALDQAGNIFISDNGNARVRKVTSGLITTVAGNGATSGSNNGDNGLATNAIVSGPFGIAVDSQGNLIIADHGNTEVRKVARGAWTAPSITSLSPTSGVYGTQVTITGSYFGSTQGTSYVTFNGTIGTPITWSDTSIVVPVPSGATTGPVAVTVGGLVSNGLNFYFPPQISSLVPSNGPTGTSAIISGSNFGTTQGTSTVTFNGVTATPSSWSNTSITVTVPSGVTTGPVIVTAGGVASNGVTFTVSPAINSLTPTSGPVGTSVTITGTSFGATQGTSTVSFNGLAAAVSSWSVTSIVVTVPSGASSGPVVVTVGGVASYSVNFTVPLYINILSATSGTVGASITITGSSFGTTQGTSSVTFNGAMATTTSWSNTMIVTSVPPGASNGPVVVTVGGVASNGIYFNVPFYVSAFSATSGGIGTPITITGSSFGATQGSSTVTFNGITATPSSWSDNIIVVPVPAGATSGPAVLTVGGISSSTSFTVLPQINSMSPAAALVGNTITITGTSFGTTQGSSTLTFNGVAAVNSSWSDTTIVTTVPTGATTGPVVVIAGGTASAGFNFTVYQISITYPASGATLNQPTTVVMGSLPPIGGEFAVLVNNKYAMINGQTFAVNNVPLTIGQNTITATLKDQNGGTASASITIPTVNQNAYIWVNSGLEQSIPTLTTRADLEGSLPSTISQTTISFDGQTAYAITFPAQLSIGTPGMHVITVTATTAAALSYQTQFAYNVLDPVVTQTLLLSKWNNMQTALLAGDKTTALTYFSAHVQAKYQSLFTNLQSYLPNIFSSLQSLYLLGVTNSTAEVGAVRIENGITLTYPVFFSQDETGAWKLIAF